MKIKKPHLFILTVVLLCWSQCGAMTADSLIKVRILWKNTIPAGKIEVYNGELGAIRITGGKGLADHEKFSFRKSDGPALEVDISKPRIEAGSGATVVTVRTAANPFSFFLRDVNSQNPVYIREYNIVVLPGNDHRSFEEVVSSVLEKKLKTKIEIIGEGEEESFDSAAVNTRDQVCPAWLGISRDARIFEIGLPQDMEVITPRMASSPLSYPGGRGTVSYGWLAGRGQGVENNRRRRLEDGILPVLNISQTDGDIRYSTSTFVTLENSLHAEGKRYGTPFLVADSSSYGHMFTPEQEGMVKAAFEEQRRITEETVLYLRVKATNLAAVPRYAWFRTVRPGAGWWDRLRYSFDPATGFSSYGTDSIFGISMLNGKPLSDEETAVLLKPGEEAVFEFRIPHEPVSLKRAIRLAGSSFDEKLSECRTFWYDKLHRATEIRVPEKRIDEMIRAGLLHLDLITYGQEPDGTLAPSVGVYSPIGTESSPIMQFYMSMRLFDQARRSLMYFLDKQHDDGMIQNFGGYMVETGAALWSMGEYFRYSADTAWVRTNSEKIVKACDYLIVWRDRNKREELTCKGYGMIDGKVADPEDPYHQFMLNGYGYLGLSRAAEMLGNTGNNNAARIRNEAMSWKEDIRKSFFYSMGGSPVVPLGDGTWCPTVPPWTEARSMRLFYLNRENFLSHGTFTVSDAMLGPLYLVFCEVLDPEEPAADMLLRYHTDIFYQRNAAFSQPYYSRHNWVQISRGMVKPFLKTYYNTFAALADRETYTFWEHLYKVSVHKTHEEAWFLMETRWMLWLEEGKTLRLLSGIPSKWLENGKIIEVKNGASYFGLLNFRAESHLDNKYISAVINCDQARKPDAISIRLPHPEGKIPVRVSGGVYDNSTGSIIINNFSGHAEVRAEF